MAIEEKDQCLRERFHAKAENDGEEKHEAQSVSHMEKVKLYKNVIKECLEWVRLIVLSTIAGLIIVGLIYNVFASTEKDIPEEVFQKLYKFMQFQEPSRSHHFYWRFLRQNGQRWTRQEIT